jgi:transcription elongation factor Elf1
MNLILLNGKFYRDGQEEPLKVGDPEQIALLQAAIKEEERKELENFVQGTIYSEEIVTYYPVLEFTCPKCKTKNKVEYDDEATEWEAEGSDINNCDASCTQCGLYFTVKAIAGMRLKVNLAYSKLEAGEITEEI